MKIIARYGVFNGYEQAMSTETFNAANGNSPKRVEPDLCAKFIFFKGIENDSIFQPLNNLMLFTSDVNEDVAIGFVMNKSADMRVHRYMKRQNFTLSDQLRFIQMFDGSIEGFNVENFNFISFIMGKDSAHPFPDMHIFGNYASYMTQTMEEAAMVADDMGARKDVVIVQNEFVIRIEELHELIQKNQAFLRDADPKIVFNQSGLMRSVLAFPEFFPNFNPAATAPKPRM